MRIHLRNHIRSQVRSHLGVVLLTVGATLMVLGFVSESLMGVGKFASATHLDYSSWLMFSGLVVIAGGAMVALRQSHPE